MSTSRTNFPVVFLAFAIIMVDGFDLQFIGLVVKDIAAGWSLPISSFGIVLSAALAGSIPGAWLAGFATHRIGLRKTLAGSLALFGTATLAALQADHISTLAGARFIAGIGLGVAVPVAASIANNHSAQRVRASLVTLVVCGQPIGAIVGAALCAYFIPIYGWHFPFVLGGVIPLLLIPAVLTVPGQRDESQHRGHADDGAASTHGRFSKLLSADLLATTTLLWISVFFASFFINSIISWLPAVVRSSGASLQMSTWPFNLFSFGGILGALVSATLIDRHGPFRIMPLLFGTATVGAIVLGLSPSFSVLCLAAAASGFAGYGGAILLGPLALKLYPSALSVMGVGWLLGVGRLGGAVGPLTIGQAMSAGMPIGRSFWLAALATFLVMLCLFALGKNNPGPRTSTPRTLP